MTSSFIIEIVSRTFSLCCFFPNIAVGFIHPSITYLDFIFSPHPKGVTEGRLEIIPKLLFLAVIK